MAELLAFAKNEFQLHQLKDGVPLIDHLEAVRRSTRYIDPRLSVHYEAALEVRYLWDWYREIAKTRVFGFAGAEALRYSEILSWCRLTGVRLQHWELRALTLIDQAFLDTVRRHDNGRTEPQSGS